MECHEREDKESYPCDHIDPEDCIINDNANKHYNIIEGKSHLYPSGDNFKYFESCTDLQQEGQENGHHTGNDSGQYSPCQLFLQCGEGERPYYAMNSPLNVLGDE